MPSPAGRYVWVLAAITASIVARNAATLVEALLRFSLPLAATGPWWLGNRDITMVTYADCRSVKQVTVPAHG